LLCFVVPKKVKMSVIWRSRIREECSWLGKRSDKIGEERGKAGRMIS